MLTEKELMKKLRDDAQLFVTLHRNGEHGRAHNVYQRAHNVALYLELEEKCLKELFGDWDSDDGTETDTARDDGLFQRWRVDEVNWRCCVRTNQTYEATVLRLTGREPLQYYTDPDYCAKCQETKKRAVRHWDDSMLG